ncbi:MAG: hypothetical protein ACXABD_22710 [Candidatus Thorarchaeota archaeon]
MRTHENQTESQIRILHIWYSCSYVHCHASMINPENNDWPGYIIAAFVLWVGINWPEWAGFWKISDD